MMKLAYQLGCQAALRKLGGLRVPVTDEQTPQAVSFKATNPQTQRLSIDSLWDNHDKRLTQFVEPSWNY